MMQRKIRKNALIKEKDRDMRIWKRGIIAACVASLLSATAMAAPIPVRGIVEGFYGTPWTQKDRIDMVKFCGEHGFNAYIYAPKDDPYHRSKWREPYPRKKIKELASLVEEAKKNHVKFIFAISPGMDMHYSFIRGSMDRILMKQKLEAMYRIGIRDFAVFFDDIEEHNGQGQAELLNWLDENFVRQHEGVSPLITVPTEYFFLDMIDGAGTIKPYTKVFSETADSSVLPLYTGNGVVCKGISDGEMTRADELYGRKLGIWWNYPVTDYMEAKLALGPVENLPQKEDIPAIFFNPMKYPEMSKIALATGAVYARDPEGYDPHAAWEQAIREQYGTLAKEMMLFSAHSQHLENNWACVGPPDGEYLRKSMDELWASWPGEASSEEKWDRVRDQLLELAAAVKQLEKKLPEKQLSECRPQLRQLGQMAESDLQALDLMKAVRDGDLKKSKRLTAALEKKLRRIKKGEKRAILSEQTCRAFPQEVLDYANTGKILK